MNVKLVDPKEGEATAARAENLIAALKNAGDQGKPFLIEWRLSGAQAQRSQGESDASCSCGGGFP
jgi:hypothetical protein